MQKKILYKIKIQTDIIWERYWDKKLRPEKNALNLEIFKNCIISYKEGEYKNECIISDNSLLQSAIDATMESINNTTINTQLTQITTEVNQPNKEVQQEVK